jgi:hypothetical protein
MVVTMKNAVFCDVLTGATWHNIPEDGIFQNYHCTVHYSIQFSHLNSLRLQSLEVIIM